MKLTFPPLHLKRDTNTGGAEVPCHGIILDGTLETCCLHQNYKKHNKINIITGNYAGGEMI